MTREGPRRSRRSRLLAWVPLGAVLLCGLSCTHEPAWRAESRPTRGEAKKLLEASDSAELARESLPTDAPMVPVRRRLRPCCVFGASVGAQVGPLPLPVPIWSLANVIGPEDVGPHKYDSGMLVWQREGADELQLNREKNGLLYTCRGGFIDTAHVRDYADWAFWLAAEMTRVSDTGGTVVLPEEAGERQVSVRAPPAEFVRLYGLDRLGVEAGIWAAYQLSVWHEIATWYGYSSVPGFSERASAFSPEDLYSNLVGARLIAGVLLRRAGRSEALYNRSIDEWFREVLVVLGAVPAEVARQVVAATDGFWWTSERRVPDPALLLRRNFDIEPPLVPWQPPDAWLGPELVESLRSSCPNGRTPTPVDYLDSIEQVDFDEFVRVVIVPDPSVRAHLPDGMRSRPIDQNDFPTIVEAIRRQSLAEFGAGSDRPG